MPCFSIAFCQLFLLVSSLSGTFSTGHHCSDNAVNHLVSQNNPTVVALHTILHSSLVAFNHLCIGGSPSHSWITFRRSNPEWDCLYAIPVVLDYIVRSNPTGFDPCLCRLLHSHTHTYRSVCVHMCRLECVCVCVGKVLDVSFLFHCSMFCHTVQGVRFMLRLWFCVCLPACVSLPDYLLLFVFRTVAVAVCAVDSGLALSQSIGVYCWSLPNAT